MVDETTIKELLEKAKGEGIMRRSRQSEADRFIEVIAELKEEHAFSYKAVHKWMSDQGVHLSVNSIVRTYRNLRPEKVAKRPRKPTLRAA